MEIFLEKRDGIVNEYSKKGHIELHEFLSENNFSIKTFYDLNILKYTGYKNTAKLYDFVISDIAKNLIFFNEEFQIMLIYADKVELLRQMIESFNGNDNASYPNIAHQFETKIRIDQGDEKNELHIIFEKLLDVLNIDPVAKIDTYFTIKADFPGGAPNKIRNIIDNNIKELKFIDYKWS